MNHTHVILPYEYRTRIMPSDYANKEDHSSKAYAGVKQFGEESARHELRQKHAEQSLQIGE